MPVRCTGRCFTYDNPSLQVCSWVRGTLIGLHLLSNQRGEYCTVSRISFVMRSISPCKFSRAVSDSCKRPSIEVLNDDSWADVMQTVRFFMNTLRSSRALLKTASNALRPIGPRLSRVSAQNPKLFLLAWRAFLMASIWSFKGNWPCVVPDMGNISINLFFIISTTIQLLFQFFLFRIINIISKILFRFIIHKI